MSKKELIKKLPGFLAMWALNVLIKVPTILLGTIMVPLLYLYRKKPFDKVPSVFLPWQNPEDWNDGINGTENSLPRWWINREGDNFKSWFKYHAIRNPANGLRNFDFIDLDLKQEEIHYCTPQYLTSYEPWPYLKRKGPRTCWYIAWQGYMAGVKFVHVWNEERYFEFKFGWRVEPRDAVDGYRESSHRWNHGAGFATKLLPYREV
jgi:hypothetical protein